MLMAQLTVLCINCKKYVYWCQIFFELMSILLCFGLNMGTQCNMFFCLLDRLFEMCISVFSFLDFFATYTHTL